MQKINDFVDVLIFTECHWYSGFARNAGTYRIATELRHNGYSVQVIDFFGFMTKSDIIKIIDKFVNLNTLALCFSSTFFNRSLDENYKNDEQSISKLILNRNDNYSHLDEQSKAQEDYPFSNNIISEIISLAKTKNNNIKTIYGGSKASNQKALFIDHFIINYGEKSILSLLQMIQMGKQNIPKQFVFDKNNDDFDFPCSQIEWHPTDYIFQNEILPIEISRGCIFKCKFCSYLLIGKKNLDHLKKPEILYSELMTNYEKFGTTTYIFCDDTFNDSMKKLEQIAQVVDKLPFDLNFGAYLRPELILAFPEQIELLKHIGLKFANFGIESINNETRKAIGKGLNFEKLLAGLKTIRDSWKDDVLISALFIFGLPKESNQTLQYQKEWLEKYSLDYFHFVAVAPLYINFLDAEFTSKSDISINYSDYGYTSIGEDNWSNSNFDMTFKEIQQFINLIRCNLTNDSRFRQGGFSGLMIQNNGITFNEIMSNEFSKLDYGKLHTTYANRITEYKKKLLK